jgi:sigma-B regulation protein RsbU (phosphoserine phosphatase)
VATHLDAMFRDQLIDRRRRLENAGRSGVDTGELRRLLDEVDLALGKLADGTFGICEQCHEPIETEALLADPLIDVCLEHVSPSRRSALEADLELAVRIQTGLLPPNPVETGRWHAAYHYEPASLVSGDYCDVIPEKDGGITFVLGDVAGHGVASALLMSHLHAMFRALVPLGLPLEEVADRASRAFCESTLPTHYATLVCGSADPAGRIEILNAGHVPPVVAGGGALRTVRATGFPLGMFCDARFSVEHLDLAPGQTIFLYSDGLSEARDRDGGEYGEGRVSELLIRHSDLHPSHLVKQVLEDVTTFRGGEPSPDDLTFMAIRRV